MIHIKGNVSRLAGVVLLATMLSASPSSAAPAVTNLTNGGSVSFASLVSSNGIPGLSVLISDMLFSNFTFEYLAPSKKTLDNLVPADLTLYSYSNQVGIGFWIQLVDFDAPTSGDPRGFFFRDIALSFTARIVNSPNMISGAFLGILGPVAGSGVARGSEEITAKTRGIGAGNIVKLAHLSTYLTSDCQDPVDYVPFCRSESLISVEKDLEVSGNSLCANYAGLSVVEEAFAQIPEPSAMVLLATGVTGLLVVRRRK
jgi:hypothetical protein